MSLYPAVAQSPLDAHRLIFALESQRGAAGPPYYVLVNDAVSCPSKSLRVLVNDPHRLLNAIVALRGEGDICFASRRRLHVNDHVMCDRFPTPAGDIDAIYFFSGPSPFAFILANSKTEVIGGHHLAVATDADRAWIDTELEAWPLLAELSTTDSRGPFYRAQSFDLIN